MKYFWTFFWTFLLAQMVTYVAGSMSGGAYNFESGLILAIGMTVFIFLISLVFPKDETEQSH